jgi:hypothetical protein
MHTYLAILLLSILSISVPVKAATLESDLTHQFDRQATALELAQSKERGSGRLENNTKERGSGRILPDIDKATKARVVQTTQEQCERGSGRCNAKMQQSHLSGLRQMT